MKIKFKKVILDNFLSFGHAEIELENRGYTLIEGINQNPKDGAKSNGSGKSTIFSAVCYALTGETIQGLSSNLNNIITGGDMSVTLLFSINADEFEITRGRSANGKADLKISINGVDKSGKGIRESQEALESLLPELTSDLIGEVIIVGQGMPHKFSNNTPSGRKDLLEKLSHSDYMLEDIKSRVESRNKTLTDKKNKVELEKAKNESTKTYIGKSLTQKREELEKYKDKPDFERQINGVKETLTKDEENLTNLQKELSSKEILLESINQNILNLNNKRNDEINKETETFNEFNLRVSNEITEKKSAHKSLLEEIKKLKSVKDVCPMCHQKLPHVHKQDTSAQEAEAAQLESLLRGLEERDDAQKESYKLNVEDIRNKYKDQETKLLNDKTSIKQNIDSLSRSISALNAQINASNIKLNKIVEEEKTFEIQRGKCVSEIQQLEKEEEDITAAILYNIKETEDVSHHLETITKMSTLVKRDFRGILLSGIISYIDGKCKEYAADIFGTTELDFKLDGNNISITYLNKPLEALSGGEQQKVDLILQFSIRAMMQEYTGFTSNIIVLDEILDNLDSVGCDAVLNFITNRLSDIESVFIISHHADSLNIGNDSTITVIKDKEGVSRVI